MMGRLQPKPSRNIETSDVCGCESEDWEGNKSAMGKVSSSEEEGETLEPPGKSASYLYARSLLTYSKIAVVFRTMKSASARLK